MAMYIAQRSVNIHHNDSGSHGYHHLQLFIDGDEHCSEIGQYSPQRDVKLYTNSR